MEITSSREKDGSTASGSGSASPPGRALFEDQSSQNEDAVPATPVNPTQELVQSPGTPLSPLVGLEDLNRDDENDDGASVTSDHNVDNAGTVDGDFDEYQVGAQVTARGTDVNVRVAGATFLEFLRKFKPARAINRSEDDEDDRLSDMDDDIDEQDHDRSFYLSRLEEILNETVSSSLDIDTMHLFHHNEASQRLYHQLVHYPLELIPLMDLVVQREARRIARVDEDDASVHVPLIQVRPFNLKEVSNLRCLDPIAMDSLVCLKGMIVRTSPIIPDLKVAHFSCVICGNDHQSAIERGRIEEPQRCTSCNTKNTFQLVHNRSLFADKQLVRLQETPDQVPPGQTPASVVTFCYDNLVDTCQPGDKVEVTGVLRAQAVRVNPKISKLKSIYKTYIDVIHFRSITGMERESQSGVAANKFSPGRVQELKRLAARPGIYEELTKSLAPSIWELDNVKKGVLCMLFGGNHRRVRNSDRNQHNRTQDRDSDDEDLISEEDSKIHKRGDINILLCGDPGTSKSQLLSYVHKLSSRGIYTSGKGSSAVGLTASVVRDPETRDLVLER